MQRRTYDSDEGWLLSYADLITNLLIFFVMLLAASELSTARMQQIDAQIEREGLVEEIRTELTDDGLKLSLNSGLVFASGAATIQPAQEALLDRMLQTLVPYAERYDFAIEGHTDSTPFGDGLRNNWDLSTDRANAVRGRLEGVGVDAARIRVEGYADTVSLPEADLDGLEPDEQLARHRRVVVRIY